MSNGRCLGVVDSGPPWFRHLLTEPFKGHSMGEDALPQGPMSRHGRKLWWVKETQQRAKSPNPYDYDGLLSTEKWQKIKTSLTLPALPSTASRYRDLDWQEHAACTDQTALFFEHRCSIRCHRHHRGCERLECVRKAKGICAECPVLEHCRIWAIETHLQHGIAGAMTERERLTVRREGDS